MIYIVFCPATNTMATKLLTDYEIAERELARRYIDPSLPLVEIGASIGGV